MSLSFIPTVKSQTPQATTFTEKLTCNSATVVSDEQWQWYKVIIELGVTAFVNVSYEGDLDVDTRLYWKRNNFPEFNGFDLTHCPVNDTRYNFTDNSQFRTTNTSLLGTPEELSARNPSYTLLPDMEAYILVFVYNGTGESTFTIVSNIDMVRIEDDLVYDCNLLLTIYITYTIISVVLFALSAFLIKRKKSKIIKAQEGQKKQRERKSKVKETGKTIDLDTEYDAVRKK